MVTHTHIRKIHLEPSPTVSSFWCFDACWGKRCVNERGGCFAMMLWSSFPIGRRDKQSRGGHR